MQKINRNIGIIVGGIVLVGGSIVLAKDTLMMTFFPEMYLVQALSKTATSVSEASTFDGILSNIDFIDAKEGISQEITLNKKGSTGTMGGNNIPGKLELAMENLPTEMAMDVAIQVGEDAIAFKGYVAEDEMGFNMDGMDDTYVYINPATLSQDFNEWEVAKAYGFDELPDTFNWQGMQPLEEEASVEDGQQFFKDWYEVNQDGITVEVQEAVKKQGEKYNVIAITLDEEVTENILEDTLDQIKDIARQTMSAQYMSDGYTQYEAEQRAREAFKVIEDEVDELDFGKGLEVICLIDSKEHIREITTTLEVANAYGEMELEWALSFEGKERLTDVVESVLEVTSEGETLVLEVEYQADRPDKDTTQEVLAFTVEIDDMKVLELAFDNETQVSKEKNTERVEGSITFGDAGETQIACDYEIEVAVDETEKCILFTIEEVEMSLINWQGVTAFAMEGEWLIEPLDKETVKPTHTKNLFTYTSEEIEALIERVVLSYY